MGLLNFLFCKKRPSAREFDKFPPVYGGDAMEPQTAAIINCASMVTAQHIIDHFISECHGKKDEDWRRNIEYFVNEEEIPEFTIRAIVITTPSRENLTYYFNIARPINATKKSKGGLGE